MILASAALQAAPKNEPVERIQEAARVFEEIQGTKDKAIPDALLSKANGIIIVPGLKRAGFIVGGQYGKGVFVARLPNGRWSAPSTIRIEGGSFGAQIGAGETDLIMLAMNQDAVAQLMKMGVKIGADVMAAAGPIGRAADAATTPIPASGLLAYSRARGIFAGATVNGSTLRSDDDDNAAIYGSRVAQSDILNGTVKPTDSAQPLMTVLRRYFRANPSDEPPPRKRG
ncbi:MAG: lipid-binding SYLF domain-containing protein [Acidobacteriaceae bacterium]|nr:lipid-binding SYLF domain-containing protein [Acidobacteriaceae bacterium]